MQKHTIASISLTVQGGTILLKILSHKVFKQTAEFSKQNFPFSKWVAVLNLRISGKNTNDKTAYKMACETNIVCFMFYYYMYYLYIFYQLLLHLTIFDHYYYVTIYYFLLLCYFLLLLFWRTQSTGVCSHLWPDAQMYPLH